LYTPILALDLAEGVSAYVGNDMWAFWKLAQRKHRSTGSGTCSTRPTARRTLPARTLLISTNNARGAVGGLGQSKHDLQARCSSPQVFQARCQARVTSQRICDTVPAEGVSNVELAASLVAQIRRVDGATSRRVGASPPSFPTLPSFKSPRS